MATSKYKTTKTINEQTFRIFSKITDFIADLADAYGDKFREIKLYNYLIGKTKFSNKLCVQRHISIFKEFCSRNQDAIFTQDPKKIVSKVISYSDRAFIDMYAVLNLPDIDKETSKNIWSHLLVIYSTIDPNSGALEKLVSNSSDSSDSNSSGSNCSNNLSTTSNSNQSNLFNANQTTGSSNSPINMLSTIMPAITSMLNGGNVNMDQVLGPIQQVINSISQDKNNPAAGIINLINPMFQELKNMTANASTTATTSITSTMSTTSNTSTLPDISNNSNPSTLSSNSSTSTSSPITDMIQSLGRNILATSNNQYGDISKMELDMEKIRQQIESRVDNEMKKDNTYQQITSVIEHNSDSTNNTSTSSQPSSTDNPD